MYKKELNLRIKGNNCKLILLFIEEKDRKKLRELFLAWKKLCFGMEEFKSRKVNIPEGISEGAFSLAFKVPRVIKVSGGPGSFDAINLNTKKRYQIKAVSVENDLTSFGPKSIWDELYWLDFYRDGKLDGSFDIYKIPNNLIYNFKVNATQTFRDQQRQGRRPRMRVRKGIVEVKGIKPIKTFKI